jgi:hypothetical protein
MQGTTYQAQSDSLETISIFLSMARSMSIRQSLTPPG